ncbi:MAG TPA: hypothetical protein VMV78_03920 [Thiobacillus sp.]|jgi:restriction system protein|nr:hypothetical protein [Thiobacillus sp.]
MARRGFFAELQHQSRVAARERERAEREAVQRHYAAVRQAEEAKKASERAQNQIAKAADSERKRLEKEAREAHLAEMEAVILERNEKLEQIYAEIDSLLASTLAVDDYVDLNTLRIEVTQPPFDRTDLEVPIPQPTHIPDPIKPVLVLPTPPSGLASFFGKKKYAEALANAQWAHEQALNEWHSVCRDVVTRRQNAKDTRARDEERRLDTLRVERERYAQECAERESEAAVNNRRLDELITNLGYGTTDAIQEYISIVLSNSVYPDQFQVIHEFEFDPSTAELRLRVLVPGPCDIPAIKSYKYTKAADEITSTTLSQKECRDRYTGAIHQVALRSFHEVFESDRRGLIKTISLEVGTNTIDPATGQQTYVPFVIAAAERETFLAFDLSAVVPALTLARLGAAVSKNPYSLVAADRSGVRRS